MTTFWYALCGRHRQKCAVVITLNDGFSSLMGVREERIARWLNAHSDCLLTFAHRDDHVPSDYATEGEDDSEPKVTIVSAGVVPGGCEHWNMRPNVHGHMVCLDCGFER